MISKYFFRAAKICFILLNLILLSSCKESTETVNEQQPKVTKKNDFIEVFGIVKAANYQNFYLDFPATVTQVYFKENQLVNKGETIVSINIDTYLDNINIKEKEIESKRKEAKTQKQEISNLEYNKQKNINQIAYEEREINKLNVELEEKKGYLNDNSDPNIQKLLYELNILESQYKKSMEELLNKEILLNNGVIPKTEYDDHTKVVDEYLNKIEDAKQSIESIRVTKKEEIDDLEKVINEKKYIIENLKVDNKSLDFDKNIKINKVSDIETGDIKVLEAELALMKNKKNKDFLQNGSIINNLQQGVIYNLNCSKGDILKEDEDEPLFSIADIESLYIEAHVPEEFIKNISIGDKVEFSAVIDRSKVYTGKVLNIPSQTIVENGQTILPIEVEIENKDNSLLLGYNVEMQVYRKLQ